MVKPPLFVQTVFGLQGGTGAHPEDVLHMKRTADRLFGDKMIWSVLGPDAISCRSRRWPPPWRQYPRRSGRLAMGCARRMAASNAEQVMLARKIIEGLGFRWRPRRSPRNPRLEGWRQAGGLNALNEDGPLPRLTLKAHGKRGKTPLRMTWSEWQDSNLRPLRPNGVGLNANCSVSVA